MQSNGSTDAVTPLGTPNLTQMDDGDAIRHEMAPRARGGGAPPWYGFKQLLTSSLHQNHYLLTYFYLKMKFKH